MKTRLSTLPPAEPIYEEIEFLPSRAAAPGPPLPPRPGEAAAGAVRGVAVDKNDTCEKAEEEREDGYVAMGVPQYDNVAFGYSRAVTSRLEPPGTPRRAAEPRREDGYLAIGVPRHYVHGGADTTPRPAPTRTPRVAGEPRTAKLRGRLHSHGRAAGRQRSLRPLLTTPRPASPGTPGGGGA